MLRVTPIYGSQWEERGPSPLGRSTLIEYGGVKVLFNVGFHTQPVEYPSHDVLVVTDGGLESMGGLPVYYKQQQQDDSKPMYATFPTVKMGQMMLYDHHASLCMDGMTPPYTLEELDTATSSLLTMKYSQTITVQNLVQLTAHRSGHAVGGAYFLLRRIQDDTTVVLTSHNYHVARELHLDSSTLLQYGATPDVLITSPGGPSMGYLSRCFGGSKPLQPQPVVTQAETSLVETIMAVLRRDGNVLLPVDASSRVLELLLVLHQQWDRQRLAASYNLIWLGPMVRNTLEFARCQLEWMATRLGSQFDSLKGHPYALPHVTLCTSVTELETLLQENDNPSCVLATGLSLDHGCARNLLLKWADHSENAIVLTDSSQASLRKEWMDLDVIRSNLQQASLHKEEDAHEDGVHDENQGDQVGSFTTSIQDWTLCGQLLRHWVQAKLEGREMDEVLECNILVPRQQALRGLELQQFQQKEERRLLQHQQKQQEQAMLREVELAKGQLRLDDDETTVMEDVSGSRSPIKRSAATSNYASMMMPKKKSRFDSSLFIKFSKPLHLTFEVREEAVGIGQQDSTAKYGIGESVGRLGDVLEDEYGIAVEADFFQDIVTGVDPSKFQQKTTTTSGGTDALQEGEEDIQEGDGREVDLTDRMLLEAQDLSEGHGIIRGRQGRPPTKISLVPRTVELYCEVHYIPLEGRGDARAARQSIRALQPRQVVLLGGTKKKKKDDEDAKKEEPADDHTLPLEQSYNEVELLAKSTKCPQETPSDGEMAELSVGHAAYPVRLIDTPLVSNATKDESPPPPSTPLLEQPLGACTVSRFDFVGTGKKVAVEHSIVLAPSSGEARTKKAILVSDGDVLLTELRAELTAQGFKAEYSSGKIMVNGKIMVVASEHNRLQVEGPLCEDFYTVRSMVCGQFVTL